MSVVHKSTILKNNNLSSKSTHLTLNSPKCSEKSSVKMRQIITTKKSSSSYSSSNSVGRSNSVHLPSAPTTPSLNVPSTNYGLQRSFSSNEVAEVIETGRGFKPSDRSDPRKNQFLTDLTKRVFKVGLVR